MSGMCVCVCVMTENLETFSALKCEHNTPWHEPIFCILRAPFLNDFVRFSLSSLYLIWFWLNGIQIHDKATEACLIHSCQWNLNEKCQCTVVCRFFFSRHSSFPSRRSFLFSLFKFHSAHIDRFTALLILTNPNISNRWNFRDFHLCGSRGGIFLAQFLSHHRYAHWFICHL